MKWHSDERDFKPPKLPKRAQGQSSSHDAITQIEESFVWLHSLSHYSKDDLTPQEQAFLQIAKRNLKKMHHRLTNPKP